MKKALVTFIDPADGCHLYKAGDPFPRDGYDPTPETMARLTGGNGCAALIGAEAEKPAEKPAAKRKTTKKEA